MYEVGIFRRGEAMVKAVSGFTHVFVEKGTDMKFAARGGGGGGTAKRKLDWRIRDGLERLIVKEKVVSSKL
ncbi:thioesterase [Histoplasma capsulatum var. duboisii H88]|nr:thioesterase [Histoplasma capsulatum var. duboisii H88]